MEYRGGPDRADSPRVDVVVQAGVLWKQSSDVDPASFVSLGLQADVCEENVSLDADGDRHAGSVLFLPGSESEMSATVVRTRLCCS